jgi:hypothetical protein
MGDRSEYKCQRWDRLTASDRESVTPVIGYDLINTKAAYLLISIVYNGIMSNYLRRIGRWQPG